MRTGALDPGHADGDIRRGRRSGGDNIERLPITWSRVIDRNRSKAKWLEQVLIEKVCQLFRNLL
ncbi:hypothetical protein F7D13_08340 [Methylocystis rosea]|uniref:Uncharacterized protein n=1 Tax=Methylocystis rosea TaxID=173366 RepID=A0ABX6EI34_9HYPH|nr:hypothetical protein F7D13_08340 [Methylocystis rosea]